MTICLSLALNINLRTETFHKHLHRFAKWAIYGVIHWEQWDVLCENIRSSGEAWYVYGVGHGVPDAPIAGASLSCALDEIGAFLKRDHDEEYLVIVYADDLSNATLVKIHDPNNLRATCGSSGRHIPPGWVLGRPPPSQIASDILYPTIAGGGGTGCGQN